MSYTTQEAIERCKTLIAEEKMLSEQKAILQGDKFADTVPSVQSVIEDIDDYVACIPGAIKDTLASIEPEKPAVQSPVTVPSVNVGDVLVALAIASLFKGR